MVHWVYANFCSLLILHAASVSKGHCIRQTRSINRTLIIWSSPLLPVPADIHENSLFLF